MEFPQYVDCIAPSLEEDRVADVIEKFFLA